MMPGGRRTTPLFDLLTKREATARPAAAAVAPPPVRMPSSPDVRMSKPVVRVELKPREVAEPPPERETPVYSGQTGAVRLPMNWVYIGVAVLGVLLFGAWLLGQKLGESRTKKDLEPMLRRPEPGVREAGADGSAPAEVSPYAPGRSPKAPHGAAGSGANGGSGGAVTPLVKNVQGVDPGSDPREKGLNYLYLAVLSKADAEAAGAFLRANSLEAYAVPWVDPKGGQANNAGPGGGAFRLFVVPGITSEEYSQKKTVRTRLETEVVRLGALWQKEHRGASNFAKHSWEKF
jgi:hypothetical protein